MDKKLTLTFILIVFVIVFMTPLYSQHFSNKEIYLKTIDYKLNLNIDYKNEKLIGKCQITVLNPTDEPIQQIPILLYRLMKVKSVKDDQGINIPFRQRVLSFDDWEVLQVNYIEVILEKPIPKRREKKITIEYEGYILGYTETGMLYVKDRIDPEFTIIRPDCKAYPEIGYPSWKVSRAAGLQNFNYSIEITVPDSFIVANGGQLTNKVFNNGLVTYTYQNIKPAWRMDIAIAKYEILEKGNNKIFYFPEDSVGAAKVMQALTKSFDLYTEWWGELHDFQVFTVIEIPDGWGSQADVTSIIQTSSAFKDEKQLHQIYHEISHLWNVKLNDTFSPRWNEGLATFLQYLLVEKFEQRKILDQVTDRIYNRLKETFQKNPQYQEIPLIEFGKENITELSYSMGMLMFQVLYNLVGEQEFNEIIGSFYQKYYKSGATSNEFVQHAKDISEFDLMKFFNDWFLGTQYFNYLKEGLLIDEIVLKYRKD
jgi:aminopeptidase N